MTGIFQKDTSFSATEAQATTLTMIAALVNHDNIPGGYIDSFGYNASTSNGTLSPNTISGYTILRLWSNIIHRVQGNTDQKTSPYIDFFSAPSFTKLIVTINGTQVTFTQDSSAKTVFYASSIYEFECDKTYVIKVISIS